MSATGQGEKSSRRARSALETCRTEAAPTRGEAPLISDIEPMAAPQKGGVAAYDGAQRAFCERDGRLDACGNSERRAK